MFLKPRLIRRPISFLYKLMGLLVYCKQNKGLRKRNRLYSDLREKRVFSFYVLLIWHIDDKIDVTPIIKKI